jgi:chromosome segregation ATPase
MKLPKFNSLNMNKELVLKIISILSLLFAITAITLSYLLFTKRIELFDNNNKMASTINRASIILDKNSGTKLSRQISEEAVKKSFETPTALLAFQKQANNVIAQRNAMGAAMEKIAKETPGAENIVTANFNNVISYKKSIEELLKSSDDFAVLRNELANKILNLSETLEVQLKNEKNFANAPTAKDYTSAFQQLNEKASQLTKDVQAGKDEITTVRSNLGKLQIELNKYIDIDSDLKVLLKEKETKNSELSQKTKSLSTQIADYKNRIKELNSKKAMPDNEEGVQNTGNNNILDSEGFLNRLHGEVLKYDKKWGNVIINLGKKNKVKIKVNDKEKDITVPLPVNSELIVARNDKFIARVKVEQVFDNYSLATVTFPLNEELKPGDIVFFPNN